MGEGWGQDRKEREATVERESGQREPRSEAFVGLWSRDQRPSGRVGWNRQKRGSEGPAARLGWVRQGGRARRKGCTAVAVVAVGVGWSSGP